MCLCLGSPNHFGTDNDIKIHSISPIQNIPPPPPPPSISAPLSQMHSLLLYEKRPEWQDWAREQMGLLNNPNLDRGPPKPSSEPLSGLTGGKSLESTKPLSSPSSTEVIPNPPRPMVSPDNNLRLPPVIPEELPSIETMREFQAVPSIPSTRLPRIAPPSSLPSSLPRPVRMPSSILEPLE